MLSKAKIKFIRSLNSKKNRNTLGLFIAEGPKIVEDLLSYYTPKMILATNSWRGAALLPHNVEVIEVTEEELYKISLMKSPQQVMAVFEQETDNKLSYQEKDITQSLSLALDGVQDPGNLGTIIRIADWFGINTIYCSKDTADIYNPKVVQATMGSMARVKVIYTNIEELIDNLPTNFPIYGTLLDGENIYKQTLAPKAIIIMGNEGKGISAAIRKKINNRLFIPPYPRGKFTAESLNVAIATSIICAEFRRNM